MDVLIIFYFILALYNWQVYMFIDHAKGPSDR